ncbi:XdhC family protein [Pseudomonadota bacterium]
MKLDTLDKIQDARAKKQPVALLTFLESGLQEIVPGSPDNNPGDIDSALWNTAQTVLRSDKSTTVKSESGRVFVQAFNPPLRFLIVGAVHITQVLAPMAALAGYNVTVIDPRGAFATSDRFPGIEINTNWPDKAIRELAPDTRTALITLSHDPKLDDPALEVALHSEVFYIACLGSRKTHTARLIRLAELGFSETELQRIKGPAGLDIGAKSPAEIAVSILAEATRKLRTGSL